MQGRTNFIEKHSEIHDSPEPSQKQLADDMEGVLPLVGAAGTNVLTNRFSIFNILEIPLAKHIVLLLAYLAAENNVPYSGDAMLFEILHFDFLKVPFIEAAKLSIEFSEKKFAEGKPSLRRLLHEKATKYAGELFENESNDSFKKVSAIIEKLILMSSDATLQKRVENIIREAGIFDFITKSDKNRWQTPVLTGLLDFVKEETRRNPSLSLQGLANIFNRMQKENRCLSLSQVTVDTAIAEKHLLPIEKINTDKDIEAEFTALRFSENVRPEIAKMEEEFTDKMLDKFVMSATALNNYLKCPLDFYFNHLLRAPCGKSEAAEFGSGVHHALQMLFEKMQARNYTFPCRQEFVNDFNWFMHRHRESFTEEQFDRRLQYGCDILSNYYDTNIYSFNKIVAAERNIKNIVVNGVPLKGKIDKLEFIGKSVNIVDYKTGNVDKALPRLKRPTEKEPDGGSFWRQAVFYKILADNVENKNWRVVSAEFDFIEPDSKKNYRKEKIIITAEDVSIVTSQITRVWRKIQNRDFYTGCGKKDCRWCNFVQSNHLAIALHDSNEY